VAQIYGDDGSTAQHRVKIVERAYSIQAPPRLDLPGAADPEMESKLDREKAAVTAR